MRRRRARARAGPARPRARLCGVETRASVERLARDDDTTRPGSARAGSCAARAAWNGVVMEGDAMERDDGRARERTSAREACERGLETVEAWLRTVDGGARAAKALRARAVETREMVRELSEAIGCRRREEWDGLSDLERLLRDARDASEPGARARSAIEALEGGKSEMLETWTTLATLDVDLRTVRAALARLGARARGVFDRDFALVDEAWATFESMLWNAVRQGILAGESGAQGLLRALRVVAEQEVLDAEFESDAATFEPKFDVQTNTALNAAPPEPKRWKTRVFAEVSSAVEAKLALIAEGFSGLDDKQSIEQVLEALDESLVSLAEMYDYTIPAFPPEWRVFEIVVAPTYHAGVCDLLVRLSSSSNTSNGDMVAAVKWSEHYFTAIQSLGLDIEITDDDVKAPSESIDEDEESASAALPYPVGLSTVIEAYCQRLRDTLLEWTQNLCRAARGRPPKADGEGKLWTPSDVEFYRLITEQMNVAISTGSSVFIRQCGRVSAEMVLNYANTVAERLGIRDEWTSHANIVQRTPSRGAHEATVHETRALPFETIVAGVNDAKRCQQLSARALNTISNALTAKDCVIEERFDHATRAYNRIHAEARRIISRRVLDEPGLNDVMSNFYRGGMDSPWAIGESMTTLLATVEDYLDDTETWLSAEVAESVTETLFEQLIELLFILFTKQATVIGPHTGARLEEDERALMEPMSLHMPKSKALGRIARLQNLRRLVCADTADDFVKEYGALLSNWPDAGLDAVATVLQARRDLDKATSRTTFERCRDVCITKLAAMSGGLPSGVGVSAPKDPPKHRRTSSTTSYAGFNRRFRDFGFK